METALRHLLNRLEESGEMMKGSTILMSRSRQGIVLSSCSLLALLNLTALSTMECSRRRATKPFMTLSLLSERSWRHQKSSLPQAAKKSSESFNAAITDGGQCADSFFGELTPDNIAPETTPKRPRHWLQQKPVYLLFIAVPAILALLVAVL